ncbi:MAG: DUF1254 domain-containing protein [Gammaproteobacteria bacterium]
MKTKFLTMSMAGLILAGMLTACTKEQVTADTSKSAVKQQQTTTVTDENYALAETQIIIAGYIKKIAAATGTGGVGVFMHNQKGADPKDRTIMRINFDTLYSFAVVDLKEDLTLVMPETHDRYQSAWIISEEHYNPGALDKPGKHKITQEWVGTRYAVIVMRTQVNTQDPDDVAKVNALQEKLQLIQKDRGAYVASHTWDMNEVLKMRAKYMEIGNTLSTDDMFGKKGEISLRNHNAGTAYGWGGFTPQQAVYPGYFPTSTEPQTLTLKDVPVKAFWSVTVYDKEGFPQTGTYNINSAFAEADKDGSVTIHFGGDKNAKNYMETFDGWNFTLRMYQPTEAYFNGTWKKPELKLEK